VALVRDPALHASLDALDGPEVRIGVNEGGHLERAARARFPRATLIAIPSNAAVERAFAQGVVDAVVSDTLEAPRWLEGAPGAETLGPFTRDRKAYLIRAERSELAAERGDRLELVSFRWPELVADLRAGRFDVAMSGITVRPERSAVGRFSIGVAESGAVALVRDPALHGSLDALDEPAVRIGVNEGGHLERAARARFPRATLVAIPSNAAVERAFAQGLVDAVVSDTLEAPHWLEGAPGAEALEPFTRDRKAYLVRAERPELASELDLWLLARESDGTLERLRAEHLGQPGPRTALPLAALVAAIDERLALMPLVALAKQRDALPLEVPAREREVLERGIAATRDAARDAGRAPPADEAAAALFRALVLAAKDVQRAPRAPAPDDASLDLDADLRPALLRIGERIAWLSLRLPVGLRAAEVKVALREGLRTPGVTETSLNALADAICALAAAPPA
jgi:cyclohexadienyl dehydratase